MQQKFTAQSHLAEDQDVEELRTQLQQLVHTLDAFEQYRTDEGHSLPPSYAQALMVLLGFHHESRNPTLTDLVELLNIDKSNVTRLCQRMKDAGHITVQRDTRDRRAKRIELSPQGLELARYVNRRSIERFSDVLHRLPEEERGRVLTTVSQLNQAIGHVA